MATLRDTLTEWKEYLPTEPLNREKLEEFLYDIFIKRHEKEMDTEITNTPNGTEVNLADKFYIKDGNSDKKIC